MFRMMLDSHPNIACGPEFKVLPCLAHWGKDCHEVVRQGCAGYGSSVPEFMRYLGASCALFLSHQAQEQGKSRAAEKTPTNAIAWQGLRSMFPDSPRIHLMRNPYHVVASLLRQRWIDENGNLMNQCRNAEAAAEWWVNSTTPAVETGCKVIRYEDLVHSPEDVLMDVCEYIDEPYDAAMLHWWKDEHNYPKSERISHGEELTQPTHQRQPHTLSDGDRATVERICGELAREFGYEGP
jgi:hypothetical protein